MSTKDEIIEQLKEKGIEHDPESTKAELAALLPKEGGVTDTIGDIEVGDPQLLRPVELPLVVKPANGGEWKNEAQAEFARSLNAYAYKNPTKWAQKKNDQTSTNAKGESRVIPGLISKLREIGENPGALERYKGHDGAGVTYSDKRIQN